MQEVESDDFDLLNGVNSIYEKGMCLAAHRVTPNTSPAVPVDQEQTSSTENDSSNYIGTIASTTLFNGVKSEDVSSSDLFPTHPTTWKQHPMNSQEHAHYRLPHQNHQHDLTHRHHERYKHRLNLITSKLLLQNSDDPLICRGANSVVATDDDHTLIVAISQNANGNQNYQMLNIQTNNSTSSSAPNSQIHPPSNAASIPPSRKTPINGCSSLTKQQLKVKAGLMSAQNRVANELRRNVIPAQSTVRVSQLNDKVNDSKVSKKKGVLKLRFHHQALPPEYLSHYEATQGKLSQRVKDPKAKASEAHQKVKVFHPSKLPPPKSTHENVRSWLQKIAAIHRSTQQTDSRQREERIDQQKKSAIDVNNNYQASRMLTSNLGLSNESAIKIEPQTSSKRLATSEISEPINCSADNFVSNDATATGTTNLATLKRVINYDDLPYMGEITLDHSKPRRGRKPKKADICHLIYKNYGTIFPGTPKNVLTTPHTTTAIEAEPLNSNITDDLPLNLCLRDQQFDHLSISSEESENVIGQSDGNATSVGSIEGIHHKSNTEFESIFLDPRLEQIGKVDTNDKNGKTNLCKRPELNSNDALLHPVSLYYQKLISGNLVNRQNQPFHLPVETIEKDNQLTLKIPIPNGLLQTPKSEKSTPLLGIDSPATDYPDLMSTPSSVKSENSNMTTTTSASFKTTTTTTTTTTSTHQQITPQKRKRSAIFIPPIPAENATSPATEVSICKFKFTGGAKPSLQEKKMLSVDSGGNYRYYSGTGDKSTRGYEFFPRESLQNSAGFLPGINCAATFPNTANEYQMSDIPPPSADLSNEILQIPESPTGPLLLSGSVVLPESSSPSPLSRSTSAFSESPVPPTQQQTQNFQSNLSSNCKNALSTRNCSPTIILTKEHFSKQVFEPSNPCNLFQGKKKPRRSSQREKLEKTFKEKGFLIQTQQLESAEGATYCKFRQLKKFTRYLFRNWKDYLPEEVHRTNTAEVVAMAGHPKAENDLKKEVDALDNFSDQLAVESIIERHRLLVTTAECAQNSDQASITSSMIEKIEPEQPSMDNDAN